MLQLPPVVLDHLLMQGRPLTAPSTMSPPASSLPPLPMVDANSFAPPPAPGPSVGQALTGAGGPPPMDLHAFDPSMLPPAQGTQAPGSMWQQFASDPANMLGLLQFGLQMLQPVQPGQSSIGHAAQAIGAGVSTIGQQKEKTRRQGMEEKQLALTERRVAADEGRLDLEGRRVAEGEKTGAVERKGKLQQIEQNEKMFPKTLSEIDAKITKLVSGGKVDEAQAEYLRERARLYPSEVNADLKRADAALKSAEKPSGTEALFESTAQAMVKAGEVATIDEARAKLGMEHFGRAGTTSATVQSAKDYEATWKRANPKQQGESDQQYDQRAATARERYMTTQKEDNPTDAFLKFQENWRLMNPKKKDESDDAYLDRSFNEFRKSRSKAQGAQGTSAPSAPATPGAPAPQVSNANRTYTKQQVEAAAQKHGTTYDKLKKAIEARGGKVNE